MRCSRLDTRGFGDSQVALAQRLHDQNGPHQETRVADERKRAENVSNGIFTSGEAATNSRKRTGVYRPTYHSEVGEYMNLDNAHLAGWDSNQQKREIRSPKEA